MTRGTVLTPLFFFLQRCYGCGQPSRWAGVPQWRPDARVVLLQYVDPSCLTRGPLPILTHTLLYSVGHRILHPGMLRRRPRNKLVQACECSTRRAHGVDRR